MIERMVIPMGKGAIAFVVCLCMFIGMLVIAILRAIFTIFGDVISYAMLGGFVAGVIFVVLIKD